MNKGIEMAKTMSAIQDFITMYNTTEVESITVFDEETVEVTYKNGYVRDIDVSGLNNLEILTKVINCL